MNTVSDVLVYDMLFLGKLDELLAAPGLKVAFARIGTRVRCQIVPPNAKTITRDGEDLRSALTITFAAYKDALDDALDNEATHE